MFRITLLVAGVLALTCTLIRPVFAVEGGKGFYLLGSKTNLAGILEFSAENRLEGDIVLFQVAFPLWSPPSGG